jgi:hypothetical protein
VTSFTPRPSYDSGKNPQYHLNTGWVGLSCCERNGENKKFAYSATENRTIFPLLRLESSSRKWKNNSNACSAYLQLEMCSRNVIL